MCIIFAYLSFYLTEALEGAATIECTNEIINESGDEEGVEKRNRRRGGSLFGRRRNKTNRDESHEDVGEDGMDEEEGMTDEDMDEEEYMMDEQEDGCEDCEGIGESVK